MIREEFREVEEEEDDDDEEEDDIVVLLATTEVVVVVVVVDNVVDAVCFGMGARLFNTLLDGDAKLMQA